MKPTTVIPARRARTTGLQALLRAATLAALVCLASPVHAATGYISDELTVPMRTGASNSHRILKVLPAGTRLEVLERDAESGFARVNTRDGTEGWVPIQYLADEPIARDRLEAATQEVERLTQTLAELRKGMQSAASEAADVEQTNTTLTDHVTRLEQELAEVKRASATAIETASANQRLTELNARLRDELDLLVEERDRLENNLEQRWMLLGGGLVLLGLILGVTIKARPRRSAWT